MEVGGSKAKPNGDKSNYLIEDCSVEFTSLSNVQRDAVLAFVKEQLGEDSHYYPTILNNVFAKCKIITSDEKEARDLFHVINTYMAQVIMNGTSHKSYNLEEYIALLNGAIK